MHIYAGYDRIAIPVQLDPPDSFLRARVVIVMLQTCGHYFVKGSTRPKLDRFITFFQRYLLTKDVLPADLDADWRLVFRTLQPKQTRFAACHFCSSEALQHFNGAAVYLLMCSVGHVVDTPRMGLC